MANELMNLTNNQLKLANDLTIDSDLDKFGYNAQAEIAKSADNLIKKAKVNDLGSVKNELINLQTKVTNAKFDSKQHGKLYNLFHKTKNRIISSAEQYRHIDTVISNIEKQLDSESSKLQQINNDLRVTQNANVKYSQKLTDYIEAAKAKLNKLVNIEIPGIEKEIKDIKSKHGDDIVLQQKLAQMQNFADRLQNRIIELQTSKNIANQQVTKTEVLIAGNNTVCDQIRAAKTNLMPIWKDQSSTSIAIVQQQEAIEMQQLMRESTNKLLTDSTNELKNNVKTIIQERQTPMIQESTLDKVNNDIADIMHTLTSSTNNIAAKQNERIKKLDQMNNASSQRLTKDFAGQNLITDSSTKDNPTNDNDFEKVSDDNE